LHTKRLRHDPPRTMPLLDGFQQNTLQTLYHGAAPPPATAPAPDPHTADFLRALTDAAARAAVASACGCLLAGHSSESDEFGDVGVWLGTRADSAAPGGADVVRALGLDGREVRPRLFAGPPAPSLRRRVLTKYAVATGPGA
jgi:hypothetical protein